MLHVNESESIRFSDSAKGGKAVPGIQGIRDTGFFPEKISGNFGNKVLSRKKIPGKIPKFRKKFRNYFRDHRELRPEKISGNP